MKHLLSFLATLVLLAPASADPPAPRPNLILILADDLGFSDLGCYGSSIDTPNLDALATGGVRFANFYNTARCWPTRVSLMTGYHYQQTDLRKHPLPCLPHYLAPLGYRSYHSGKWHLHGTQPVAHGGFHRSYWLPDHDRFFSPQKHFLNDNPLPAVPRDSGHYVTTSKVDYALQFLREHEQDHAGDPFFLYLAFTSPHFPLQALPRDIVKYEDSFRRGWDVERAERLARLKSLGLVDTRLSPRQPDVRNRWSLSDEKLKETFGAGDGIGAVAWDTLTKEQKDYQARKMAIHAAMIDRMDQEIGRLLGHLREAGKFDNTLILFLSDNGASSEQIVRGDKHDRNAPLGSADSYLTLGPGWSTAANTPFLLHKHWTHEGGCATPFIAHWPEGIADSGSIRTEQQGHVIDLPPTMLAAATGSNTHPQTLRGGENPPPLPGRSILASLTSGTLVAQDHLYFEHQKNHALRQGDWKIVRTPYRSGEWELYDLSKDRSETTDLAPEKPGLVKELAARHEALRARFAHDSQLP